jgi:hypothetical protein
MKVRAGQVWSYANKEGRIMKRLILSVNGDMCISRVLVCPWTPYAEGSETTLEVDFVASGDRIWILDETSLAKIILESYE